MRSPGGPGWPLWRLKAGRPRPGARRAIGDLRSLGIERIVMLTDGRPSVSDRPGGTVYRHSGGAGSGHRQPHARCSRRVSAPSDSDHIVETPAQPDEGDSLRGTTSSTPITTKGAASQVEASGASPSTKKASMEAPTGSSVSAVATA